MLQKPDLKLILCVASLIVITTCVFVALSRAKPKPARPREPSPAEMVVEYWTLSELGRVEEAEKYLPETYSDGKVSADMSYLHLESTAVMIYKSRLHLVRIISEAEKDDRAQVVAETLNTFGGVNHTQHNLHKEDGKWKLFTVYTITPSLCKYSPHMCNFVDK